MIVNPIYNVLCKYCTWKLSIVLCVQYTHNVNNFNTDNFRSLIHIHLSLNIWNYISQGFLTFLCTLPIYLLNMLVIMKGSYIYSINLLIRLINPILFQLIYRKVGDNAYIPKKIHILFLLKKTHLLEFIKVKQWDTKQLHTMKTLK